MAKYRDISFDGMRTSAILTSDNWASALISKPKSTPGHSPLPVWPKLITNRKSKTTPQTQAKRHPNKN